MTTAAIPRPEFYAETWMAAARVVELPQSFGDFDAASMFADLRGWSTKQVKMTRRDGVYTVREIDDDCKCPQIEMVERG